MGDDCHDYKYRVGVGRHERRRKRQVQAEEPALEKCAKARLGSTAYRVCTGPWP
jgi:hypothetical protein